MKTLEELGFVIKEEYDGNGDVDCQFVIYVKPNPDTTIRGEYTDTYTLFGDGQVFGNENNGITQEIYEAIGLEMKRRGWWK